MDTPVPKKPRISRPLAYGILFALALLFTLMLVWITWRSMAVANPWFSAIGIVIAIGYVAFYLSRNKHSLSFDIPPPAPKKRPLLRIVKK